MAAIPPANALHDEGLPTSSDEVGKPTDSRDSEAGEKLDVDVLPEGGYEWVSVACNFWINADTWGVNSVCQRIKSSLYRIHTF